MNIDAFIGNTKTPKVLFCTGAGLSAESGIRTFRGEENALWEEFDVDKVCNIANFNRNYDLVHQFYNKMRIALKDIEPNAAHKFITNILNAYGENRVYHLTTNVDNLAEKAGHNPFHVHGNLLEVVEPYVLNGQSSVIDVGYNEYHPKEGMYAKPNVVFFGESVTFDSYGNKNPIYNELRNVVASLTQQDLVIVIGSSDSVVTWSYILNGLCKSINVNIEANDHDYLFTKNIYKPCTEVLDELDLEIYSVLNG